MEARNGKDIQGIPWERLNFTRDQYRETRLKQYKNYESLTRSGQELELVSFAFLFWIFIFFLLLNLIFAVEFFFKIFFKNKISEANIGSRLFGLGI